MRRLLIVSLFLGSCIGYQPEPYAEFQIRDEHFEPSGGASEYGGETWMVGIRYRAPTYIIHLPHPLVAPRVPTLEPAEHTTTINIPKDEKSESTIDELANLGKNKDGNWTWPGLCALLIVGFVFREVWLKKASSRPGGAAPPIEDL